MKVDSRGRVRFTHNNIRVEVTNTGVRLYRRYYNNSVFRQKFAWMTSETENRAWCADDLTDVTRTQEGRDKLEEALRTLREHEASIGNPKAYTTNIIIPKHMRAV
jgi:hypothetical protein